jgi:hypothetical protein
VAFPPAPKAVQLTERLGAAIDEDAAALAARPVPGALIPA